MRVFMVTPEVTPYAQTGGLGEVLSALPAELAALGVEVDVLMPKYRGITPERFSLEKTDLEVEIVLNDKPVQARLWRHEHGPGCRYFFLECDEYYDRDYLYGTPDKDYEDNSERFVFLSRAAIEISLLSEATYDVFHCHDWQAALTPVYLRTLYAGEKILEDSASIVTIHNLGYQGIFRHLDMPLIGVGWEFFTPRHMEFYGKVNFLKAGIVFADMVNTVSPEYRNQILTEEFGFGLEGVLRDKGEHVVGILNGVEYAVWNPETDLMIAAQYSSDDLSGKVRCKADLQQAAHLPVRADVPLVGMVSRLSSQKGIDLLEGAVPALMERDIQLVLLGTGDRKYERSFQGLADSYPERIGAFLSYDYELAHKIFAGSDMLAVPSRYEPCGLNQLYALRYGTVPVVRATGGLVDTVEDFHRNPDTGTGFKFLDASPGELENALMKAVEVYLHDPGAWQRLMLRGMGADFSWKRSAQEYLRLYEQAVQRRADFMHRGR